MRPHLEQVQRRTSEPPDPGRLVLIERSLLMFGFWMCAIAGAVVGIIGYILLEAF